VVHRFDGVGLVGLGVARLEGVAVVVYGGQVGGGDGGFGGRVGRSEHADVAEAAGFEVVEVEGAGDAEKCKGLL